MNGSRVSPGYLPFLFNWQASLEHSIGLLQEANSIRGVLNSQWMEQPWVSTYITNLLSIIPQVCVEGQQRLRMNLSTME